MRRIWVAGFVTLLMSSTAEAGSFELLAVRFDRKGPTVVLPIRAGDTAPQAIARYRQALHAEPDLRRLLKDEPVVHFDAIESEILRPRAPTARPRAAVFANAFADHYDRPKISNVIKQLRHAGSEPMVLALGGELAVDPHRRADYLRQVGEYFDMGVGLGGADIHPELYYERVNGAMNANYTRDILELRLAAALAPKMLVGICRGAQLFALLLKQSLYQDLVGMSVSQVGRHLHKSLTNSAGYGGGNWSSHIAEHATYHPITVSPSVLGDLMGGPGSYTVNSFHHQGIRHQPSSEFEVVARGDDGVIEAFQSRDGRIFGLQFHFELAPEMIANDDFREMSAQLMHALVARARQLRLLAEGSDARALPVGAAQHVCSVLFSP
jgi:putative glutamine amidotransferase